MNTCLFLIFTIYFFGLVNAKLSAGQDFLNLLDRDLHQRVLDPDECQRQLKYIRWNNTLLLAQFLDAGLRIPKGMLKGNLDDYGSYHQCLGINEDVPNMAIGGKFCLIKVSTNQDFRSTSSQITLPNFDLSFLQLPLEAVNKLKESNTYIDNLRATFGNDLGTSSPDNPLFNVIFTLALCIPKVCTTKEALGSNLGNEIDLGFQYEDIYCRLPNDKPWVAADYVAIVLFSLIGLLTLMSTSYDVYHTVICKRDPKNINDFLRSFSAYTNCQRLLIIKSNPNAIECLDGIRSLATLWVVVGHVFYAFNFFHANTMDAYLWLTSYNSIMIMTAPLSVDTFFLISGLLLVYNCANRLTGRQLIQNIPVFYLSRLFRMFPVLAAVILFEASLYNRLGDGPKWDNILQSVDKCRTLWWTTLLHVQNFVNPEEVCIIVTWYLALDVQLHILSPIVLFWVLGRKKRMAWSALFLTLLISLTASTGFIFSNEFSSHISNEGLSYYIYVYVNILTRAPPFFVGMIYGYALHMARGKKVKMPIILSVFLTTLSILLLALIIQGISTCCIPDDTLFPGHPVYCKFVGDKVDFKHQAIKDMFDSFLRPFWAVGWGWIIYACHTGYGGPINWLLILNMWKIPSRISYAIYLTHLSLILVVYSNALQPMYFTVSRVMFDAMAFIFITLVVSFFVTILIDSPFAILCKLLLGRATKKSGKQFKSNDNVTVAEHLPASQPTNKNDDFH